MVLLGSKFSHRIVLALFACLPLATGPLALAQQEGVPTAESQRQQLVSRGAAYLLAKGQAEDGSFSRSAGPGLTAICTTALLRSGRTASDPAIQKSLDYLLSFQKEDGGLYQKDSTHRNYETCLIVLCLTEANSDGRFNEVLQKAEKFVKLLQWDQTEEVQPEDVRFGGAGYGSRSRPDLSNTSFLIDALRSAGADSDDEAIQRALVFVSRCQNLETEHNQTEFAALNPDGGFYYTPAAGGSSMAGTTENGGLRSYASMTYAGLKSMIFAGVGPDDPRVKAAYNWARENYSLQTNPGMGTAGLYYYYHTFAKALHALGAKTITDAQGAEHDWRAELIQALAQRQQPDGSWVNENSRWLEGDPNLVSAYALLALSYCEPAK